MISPISAASEWIPACAGILPLVVRVEVGEARQRSVEVEFHRSDRTVTLLADDAFGGAVRRLAAFAPLGPGVVELFLVRIFERGRLFAFEIIFFTEHEHDDVGVLFDRT